MPWSTVAAEPTAEADRGRHPGFPSFNVHAGGPGSLALALGRNMARGSSERSQDEYRVLSAFLDYFSTHVWGIPPDSAAHPAQVGRDILQRVGLSKALAGVRQAVNDAIEATTDLDVEGLRRLDRALAERRIITLSELRRRYWRKYRSVIVRRHIRNDTEYYLAVGMLWRAMKALAKSFDASSCAAARVGPKIASPASRNVSTTPAASGASGPTTVSWT